MIGMLLRLALWSVMAVVFVEGDAASTIGEVQFNSDPDEKPASTKYIKSCKFSTSTYTNWYTDCTFTVFQADESKINVTTKNTCLQTGFPGEENVIYSQTVRLTNWWDVCVGTYHECYKVRYLSEQARRKLFDQISWNETNLEEDDVKYVSLDCRTDHNAKLEVPETAVEASLLGGIVILNFCLCIGVPACVCVGFLSLCLVGLSERRNLHLKEAGLK